MAVLTFSGPGGTPVWTVSTAVAGGFSREDVEDAVGVEVLEERYDMSLASIVIGPAVTRVGRERYTIRTVPMAEATRLAFTDFLAGLDAVTVDGSLVDDIPRTCRVESVGYAIGGLRDQEVVNVTLIETGED